MIDSHCHLADASFAQDLPAVLARARDAGVRHMICIADDISEAKRCLQIAREHENISATVGIHPHNASGFELSRDIPILQALAHEPSCVAIGEIGLDYHYMRSVKSIQQQAFEAQLSLSRDMHLPAVIHCREAVEDVWAIVNHVRPKKAVIHCCTEAWSDVERFVEAGYYLSFTGIATFPQSHVIRETIHRCPLERLMIETDSPYLAPVPHRGMRNEPAYVALVAACIAHVKSLSYEEVMSVTTMNAQAFFSLSATMPSSRS